MRRGGETELFSAAREAFAVVEQRAPLEVELKIKVDSAPEAERALMAAGASLLYEEEQIDTYFQHPSRDFKETDEALRVRRAAGKAFIAYKGPKLSKLSKTRVEIEIPVPDADAAEELFRLLGFTEVARVEKVRRAYAIEGVKVYVDSVKGLGNFVELELPALPGEVREAEETLQALAERLGLPLDRSTLKSYLELILESREGR